MASTTDRILQIVIKAKDQASKALGDAAGNVAGSMSKIRDAMGAVGLAAAGYLKSAVDSAVNAQKVNANLEQTLKSTGGAVGMTAKQLSDMAGALSKTTLFTGGQIKSGEAMLLTFTNIGKKVFPQATQAMLDLSQKMGTDPQQTAIQLGKALNDPVKGLTALQRVGVTFSDAQKKQIQAMVDTNNVAGAQTVILNELNKEFGGQATAAANTYDGQMKQIGKTMTGIKTTIGTVLLPYLQTFATKLREITDTVAGFITAHKQLVTVVLSLTAVFGTLIGGVGMIQKVFGIMKPMLGPIGTAITGVGEAVGGLALPITIVIGAIALLTAAYVKNWGGMRDITNNFINTTIKFLVKAFNDVKAWFIANWPLIQATFTKVLTAMQTVFTTVLLPILRFIIQQIGVVITWVQQNWPLIQQTIVTVFNFIKAIVTTVLGWLEAYWKQNGQAIITNVKYAWDIIKTVIGTVLNVVLGIIKVVMDLITGHWKDAWNTLVSTVKTLFGGIGRIVGDILGALGNTFTQLGKNAIQWGEGLINGFIQGIKNMAGKVVNAAKGVIGGIANFLGFHSPAKEGEGRDIILWGSNMVQGFMDGINLQLPKLQTLMSNVIKAPTGYGSPYNQGVNKSNSPSENVNPSSINKNNDDKPIIIPVYLDGRKIAQVLYRGNVNAARSVGVSR